MSSLVPVSHSSLLIYLKNGDFTRESSLGSHVRNLVGFVHRIDHFPSSAGDFIYKVSSQSPTKHFIIHSRKALLNGITPKENRSIPPLKYECYYAFARDFPDLQFTLNGGINTINEVEADSAGVPQDRFHTVEGLDHVIAARKEGAHGVMVGRAAYNNPWNVLAHVDSAIYGSPPSKIITRPQTLKSFFEVTLIAIPDYVLDSPLTETPVCCSDLLVPSHGYLLHVQSEKR